MAQRTIDLAQRQPTEKDWDDFFHYCLAFRRNRTPQDGAFELTPMDKAQAELDAAKEMEALLEEDDRDNRVPVPNNPKRKRRTSPTPPRQAEP